MKKILGLRNLINLTLAVMLIGGAVFAFGFGLCLYIARQEVQREASEITEANIEGMHTYVDCQLQRVEDAAYTLLSTEFGKTTVINGRRARIDFDPKTYRRPSPQDINTLLSCFLDANPHVCGIAIGFEPDVYPEVNMKYGYSTYITNVSGGKDTLLLGDIHDYRQRMWYKQAADNQSPQWSTPFRETSRGKVVTCYSVPLYGENGRFVGVLGVDIDNEEFRHKCTEMAPFPGSEVAVLDHGFHFVAHPDSTYDLKHIDEVLEYDANQYLQDSCLYAFEHHQAGHCMITRSGNETMFYFTPIKRTGWTITIESPNNVIMRSITKMKRRTSIIAIVSVLIMIVCFVWLFRRMQGVALAKAGIDSELKIASSIQMDMLPKNYPAYPERDDLDIYGYICPAKSVGGDLYDYFIRDEKLYFCIGDVSGKGVPASLFMAVIHALFRNITQHTHKPAHIMKAMNEALSEGNEHNMFCTMFMGIIDLNTGWVDYCNAGHCVPIVVRSKGQGIKPLNVKTNLALGIIDSFNFESQSMSLDSGDAIFMYTDGVSEAENNERELFGDAKALNSLNRACHEGISDAKGMIDVVKDDISAFVGIAQQSDDVTMLMIKYKGLHHDEHSLHLTNDVNQVSRLTMWVEKLCTEAGIAPERLFNINLAVEEAVVNVMNYAYGDLKSMPVDLEAEVAPGKLRITIKDEGVAFDPTAASDPDLTLPAEERPIGGLGIMLVRKFTTELDYKRVNDCNYLTLTF